MECAKASKMPMTPMMLNQLVPLPSERSPSPIPVPEMKPSGSSFSGSPVFGSSSAQFGLASNVGASGTLLRVPSRLTAGPWIARVRPHQIMTTTAITVVAIMIFTALSLDS